MIGKKIQNYEIKSHLGEGGMGTVFRAGDSVLDREVALKMLHAPLLQQPLFLERFKKEARVLAQLLHPNIAVIYNMIEQDNNHFMVMEYVEGRNLDALLRQYQTLSYKVVVPVFVQALEGLHHAHKKGIYHRDIKPANLILTPDGTVKLMDFGIAMVKGEQRLTQVNRVVGTVEYIAPEIIQGKEPSIATDLYAVGVTMYELLTGKLPFEGNTDYNLMQDILKKKPLSVDKLNASVPRALSNIVMKTLEKKPEDRFANAKELQQALMAAFPDLKFAELNNAYINEATKVVAHPTVVEKKFRPKPTAIATTGTGHATKAFSVLAGLKEKIIARENRLVVISLSAVFLTVVLVLLFKSSGQLSSTKISSAQSDSTGNQINTQQKVQQNQYENNSGSVSDNQPINSNPVIIDTKLPEEGKEKKDESGKNKKEESNKENKEKDNVTDKKKQEEEKKEEDAKPVEEEKKEPEKKTILLPPDQKKEETKPVERISKTIHIAPSLDVDLYLREPLNEATVKEGQALYFSVTKPVTYKGDVIIERGATARGKVISVGKKKIGIIINSVTAVNGQTLSIQPEELSGRIEDMVRNRNYSANLKRSITINL